MTIAKGNQNIVIGSNKSITDSIAELEIDFNEHAGNALIHTPALTADKTIYVDVNKGSDETGDGSESKPYRSINFAKSKAPKLLVGYTLAFMIADGIYDEDVIIRDFVGANIVVYATEKVIIKSLTIYNVKELWWQNATITGFTTQKNQIEIASCQAVNLWGFKCTAIDKAKIGIRATGCPKIQIYNSEISGKNIAVQSSESIISTCFLNGSNNNIGYLAGGIDMTTGGFISIGAGTILTADKLIDERWGGKVFGGNQIKNWDAKLNIDDIPYNLRYGYYVKNGNLINATIALNIGINIASTAPDNTELKIINLPYVSKFNDAKIPFHITGIGVNNIIHGIALVTGTQVILYKIDPTISTLKLSDLKSNNAYSKVISFNFKYFTES